MLTIHAIRGKVLRCKDDQEPQDAEGNEILKDFQTHRDCEVFLNGEPATLAELSNGDRASIRNGVKEGFKTVEATRNLKSTASQRPNAAKQIPATIREDQAPPANTPKPESAPPTHTSSMVPPPENTAEGSLDKSEDELRRSESSQPNAPPDEGEDDTPDHPEETPAEAPPEGSAKEDKKHPKPTARRRPH